MNARKNTAKSLQWWHLPAIPLLVITTVGLALATIQFSLNPEFLKSLIILGTGFGAGAMFFTFFYRFEAFYVFGHELTHWFVAKLFFRKTGGLLRMRVEKDRGCVLIENPNTAIILAPYFVPFYTLVWCGFYGIWLLFCGDVSPDIGRLVFYGGTGVTFAYHVVMTLWALLDGQQDLQDCGPTFSLCLIFFVNILVIYTVFVYGNGQWREDLQTTLTLFMRIAAWLDTTLTLAGKSCWEFIKTEIFHAT